MNDFMNCVAIAGLLTLYDELRQEQKDSTKGNVSSADPNLELPIHPQVTTKDPSNGCVRLCKIAEDIIKSADLACNTTTDVQVDVLVPMTICSFFYEALNDLAIDTSTKIRIYDYATNYCKLDTDLTGELMFSSSVDGLATIVLQGADILIELLITGGNNAGKGHEVTGFILALVELISYAEESIVKFCDGFQFDKKPAVFVFEKAQEHIESKMREMEAEDPTLKDFVNDETERDKLLSLLNSARIARENGDMATASDTYKKALTIDKNNWEAVFFSVFCSLAVSSPKQVHLASIFSDVQTLQNAAVTAIPLAKQQLFTRIDTLDGLQSISISLTNLSTHYFVATMQWNKKAPHTPDLQIDKGNRVAAIMEMLFNVGDVLEENCDYDREICVATAYTCWLQAMTMYENCDMAVPPKTYEHYMKIKKYNPSYHCNKSIVPAPTSNSTRKSGGCYVATCVYGSYDCPQVWTLRRFRDDIMAQSVAGRLFIKFY